MVNLTTLNYENESLPGVGVRVLHVPAGPCVAVHFRVHFHAEGFERVIDRRRTTGAGLFLFLPPRLLNHDNLPFHQRRKRTH